VGPAIRPLPAVIDHEGRIDASPGHDQPAFHAAGDYAETGFTLAGSILLLVGHRRNTCAGHTR